MCGSVGHRKVVVYIQWPKFCRIIKLLEGGVSAFNGRFYRRFENPKA